MYKGLANSMGNKPPPTLARLDAHIRAEGGRVAAGYATRSLETAL
jgi:hypothetical protein